MLNTTHTTSAAGLRIWLLSDIHTEASDFVLPDPLPDFDVVVVPGDVAEGLDKALDWLSTRLVPLGKPVIFVMGNHDFYGLDFAVDRTLADRAAALGITALVDGASVVLEGVRFVGATLWTDFAIADDVYGSEGVASRFMPDFNCIDVGMRRLWPRDLRDAHLVQLGGIVETLSVPFEGDTVVVTHHAPHRKSLRDGRVTDLTDAAFASDLTWVMEDFSPALWLHGHVHDAHDYEIGATRVVCNPRGYVTKLKKGGTVPENAFFEPSKVLVVGGPSSTPSPGR